MSVFRFRKFDLRQERNAMKVGTDSTLLGSMIDGSAANSILDIGTGTGVVALMLAQRSLAQIDAIEIDKESWAECITNFNSSPWANRLRAHHCALQTFYPSTTYDLIVSNPPYFHSTPQKSLQKRFHVRQQALLTHEELLTHALRLLSPAGRIGLVLPVNEGNILLAEVKSRHQLHCIRLITVYGKQNNLAKRLIMELSRIPTTTVYGELIIEKEGRHDYSDHYLSLMSDFLFLKGNSKSS
jgi:tRNA1Val (adenine37-N6)-methyltransferase